MKTAEHDRLMQAVLDGEATPGESAELEASLAADPAARAASRNGECCSTACRACPTAFPPEGLVAAVMADLPREAPPGRATDQLFPPPGVIAASSKESRVTSRGTSTTVHAISQTGPFTRGAQMSEQQRTFSKTKVWIGVAVAVAAIAVGSQFVDYPPKGQDATGTIAPAQRYRAAQPTADDVKLGNPSAAQSGQVNSAVQGAAANEAANSVTRNARRQPALRRRSGQEAGRCCASSVAMTRPRQRPTPQPALPPTQRPRASRRQRQQRRNARQNAPSAARIATPSRRPLMRVNSAANSAAERIATRPPNR